MLSVVMETFLQASHLCVCVGGEAGGMGVCVCGGGVFVGVGVGVGVGETIKYVNVCMRKCVYMYKCECEL